MDNQHNQDNQERSRQELQRQQALQRLNSSEDYQKYLKPLLEAQVLNKWLDPSSFPTFESFHKAYSESFGRAAAFKEVLAYMSTAEAKIKVISDQLAGNLTKPYEF